MGFEQTMDAIAQRRRDHWDPGPGLGGGPCPRWAGLDRRPRWRGGLPDRPTVFGRSILLGLEFLVAADIIRTVAVQPSLENVAVLGLIVLIRTFLSFSLEVESRMEGSDGNASYWVATAPATSFPPYRGDDLKVDVAVLGGGITGLTTAMLLQQAGASVAVVEAGRVACGVTGYTTAKVTSLHGLTYAKLTSTFGPRGPGSMARPTRPASS